MIDVPFLPNPPEAAAPVSRISHVSLRTPRLDAMVRHYTTVLGLTLVDTVGDAVHLATSNGTPALELLPGSSPGLDHLGFDLHRDMDIDMAAKALDEAGLLAGDWEGLSSASGGSLKLVDPDGAQLQVMSRPTPYATVTQPHQGVGVKPFKLGHVASRVSDLSGVVRFYQSALGFRFSDMIGDDFVFLRCNSDHHAVNFLKAGAPRNVHHVAFELQDWGHIKLAADELWSHGIPLIWGPGRHGAGHNLYTYHRDPDNNIVELFAELDKMTDETAGFYDWRPWHDGPQEPKKWDPHHPSNNPWGLLPPDGFLF